MSSTSPSGLWNRKSAAQQQQQQQQPQLIDSSPGNSETSSVGSFSMDEEENEHDVFITTALSGCQCQQQQQQDDENDDDTMEQGIIQQQQQEEEEPLRPVVDPNHFTYRPIQTSDRDRVKELHEEWFPVTYQDEFYNDLAEGHLAGVPVFTRIAIYNPSRRTAAAAETTTVEQDEDDPFTFGMDDEEAGIDFLSPTHGFDDSDEDDDDDQFQPFQYNIQDENLVCLEPSQQQQQQQQHPNVVEPDDMNDADDVIAGCIVGSFMPVTRLPASLQDILVPNPIRHSRLFYIMTLGTVTDYRHAGLGTRLVQQCIDQVEQDERCGTLYLHCITFNQGAIQLYEKLGFFRVQEIPDYYDIQGEKYPCYLYAKYFHGNPGHRDIYKMIAQCVWSFVRQVLHLANIPPGLLLGSSGSSSSSGGGSNNSHYADL